MSVVRAWCGRGRRVSRYVWSNMPTLMRAASRAATNGHVFTLTRDARQRKISVVLRLTLQGNLRALTGRRGLQTTAFQVDLREHVSWAITQKQFPKPGERAHQHGRPDSRPRRPKDLLWRLSSTNLPYSAAGDAAAVLRLPESWPQLLCRCSRTKSALPINRFDDHRLLMGL